MSKAVEIFNWVKILLPIILMAKESTRALASPITDAVTNAEQLFGPKTGKEKLEYAIGVGQAVGDAINTVSPGKINTVDLTDAIACGINTAFSMAKLVNKEQGAPQE